MGHSDVPYQGLYKYFRKNRQKEEESFHSHKSPLTTCTQNLHSRLLRGLAETQKTHPSFPQPREHGAGKVDILPIITMMIITVMIIANIHGVLPLCCTLLSMPPINAHI